MQGRHLSEPQRNFAAGVFNGALFALVEALMDPSVVLVVFVTKFTSSNFLLTLIGVLPSVGWFLPQLWVSGYLQHQPLSKPLYRVMALLRTLMRAALFLVVLTVSDPTLLLVSFYLLIAGESLASGFAGLPFMDIVGKVIPAARRGVFFSWRWGLGGIAAIGGGWLASAVLATDSPLEFPRNFGLLFGLSAALSVIGFLFWLSIREPAVELRGRRTGPIEQVRLALQALRQDANYRVYLQTRAAMILVFATMPIVTNYAKKGFAVPDETLASYAAANAIGRLMGTLLAGQVSARLGNRPLIRLGTGLGMVSLLMIILAGIADFGLDVAGVYFMLASGFLSLCNMMVSIALVTLNVNVAPDEKRPLYIGFGNTLMGVFLLASSLAGALVDVIGFQALFLLALLPMSFGVWRLRALYDPSDVPNL